MHTQDLDRLAYDHLATHFEYLEITVLIQVLIACLVQSYVISLHKVPLPKCQHISDPDQDQCILNVCGPY